MRNSKIIIALAAIVLASTAAAETGTDMFQKNLVDTAGIAALLLFISGILAGLVYMAGSALMNDKVKGWAKTEFVEIFVSGVILVMIVSVCTAGEGVMTEVAQAVDPFGVSMLCGAAPALSGFVANGQPIDTGYENLPCHIRIAKNYLASIFYEVAGLVKAVGITHSWYTYLSSFGLDFTPVGTTTFFSGASFSHGIFGFLNAKNNALSFLFDNGVKVLILVRFQEVFLNFAAVALFPALLAAGVILRTFMLTRRLGGLLMAIAISIYFIYPIFYILGSGVYHSVALAEYRTVQDPSQTPVLAKILSPDYSAMPSGVAANEQPKVNTDVGASGGEILGALGIFSNAAGGEQLCKQQSDSVDAQGPGIAKKDEGFWATISGNFENQNGLLRNMLASSYVKGGSANPLSFDSIIAGIDALSKALFFSAFFSLFAIFATVAAVKSISPMLGGDVEIAGLTYLI